jgi:hypothetical protein
MKPMSRSIPNRARKNEILAAVRQRQKDAGRVLVQAALPADLIEIVDRMKEERGLSGRGPLIEEALRLLIEKQRA